jgi:hypothetical protein
MTANIPDSAVEAAAGAVAEALYGTELGGLKSWAHADCHDAATEVEDR